MFGRVLRGSRRFSLAVLAGGVALSLVAPAVHADVRVGQNYRLTSDQSEFRGKDEVALAVNPANPRHIVQTNANYLTQSCEGTASFDGGETWSDAFTMQGPVVSSGFGFTRTCRVGNHLGETMYQSVAFGSGNNVYTASILPREASFGEESAGIAIYKSTDGGVTWGRGVVAMVGGPGSATAPSSPAAGP